MAYTLFTYLLLLCLALSNFCHGFNPKLLNVSKSYGPGSGSGSGWATTQATWYGAPNGFGSDGGACGYTTAVSSVPFSSIVTAIAPTLYDSGHGCGTCYLIKCSSSTHCSGNTVRVVATDECPGCDPNNHLFDLSGTSFGLMAISGQEDQLRKVGNLEIQYQMVECNYPGVDVAFRVDTGSNANYFAVAIEYEDGDGLTGVELRQSNTANEWLTMTQLWGSVWKVDLPNNYPSPFSIKLIQGDSTIIAENVIPAKYATGKTYTSKVNF
ncbi:expansin B2 [Striga asiatica]|uniref:Expansin B2 n=1 Tax=Striga asiatica TaxID=4170 RepID=A0A5A7PMC6_STRAF|nr:expansin B2 [Striga asiatica]